MSSFSSKDFSKVAPRLTPVLPERLIHRNVTDAGVDSAFSQERKHPVHLVDLPSKILSMTIGGLHPGQSSGRHRHNYETVIYVLRGQGRTIIEDRIVEWAAGDAIYIPVWAWHHHENKSFETACEYIACENAPMLQNLGIALREEEGLS